jgi:hypothetical protein
MVCVRLLIAVGAASLVMAMVAGANAVVPAPGEPTWQPQMLDDPTLVRLPNGNTYTRLDQAKDYVVQFPSDAKVGSTTIEGGRNILMVGGHLTVPVHGESDMERRGLYIKNAVGVVHVEGLLIDGENLDGFDAIAISAPRAVVQLVNIRVEGVVGRSDGFHGDVVQPFGGVAELRIDRMTGTSNYQGLYLAETRGWIGSVDIRNVNLAYVPNIHDETTYLLWLPADQGQCETYPITLENVYIAARPGQEAVKQAVWPNDHEPSECLAKANGNKISWPELANVRGSVTAGTAPGGDFVPQGQAGTMYEGPMRGTDAFVCQPIVSMAVWDDRLGGRAWSGQRATCVAHYAGMASDC